MLTGEHYTEYRVVLPVLQQQKHLVSLGGFNCYYLCCLHYKLYDTMKTIPFGVSINQVGALTVTNFRIRTVYGSLLDKFLQKAWDKIQDKIGGEDLMFNNHRAVRGGRDNKYITHDFSSCGDRYFFEMIYPIIRRAMLDAEVKTLEEKYRSLHIGIELVDLPEPYDYEPTEADCWDGDGSVSF